MLESLFNKVEGFHLQKLLSFEKIRKFFNVLLKGKKPLKIWLKLNLIFKHASFLILKFQFLPLFINNVGMMI